MKSYDWFHMIFIWTINQYHMASQACTAPYACFGISHVVKPSMHRMEHRHSCVLYVWTLVLFMGTTDELVSVVLNAHICFYFHKASICSLLSKLSVTATATSKWNPPGSYRTATLIHIHFVASVILSIGWSHLQLTRRFPFCALGVLLPIWKHELYDFMIQVIFVTENF